MVRKKGFSSTPLVASLKLLFSGCGCAPPNPAPILTHQPCPTLSPTIVSSPRQRTKNTCRIKRGPCTHRPSSEPQISRAGKFLLYQAHTSTVPVYSSTECPVLTATGLANHPANKLLGPNHIPEFIFSTETANFLLNFAQLP